MNKNNTRRHLGKPGPRPDLTDFKRAEAKERQVAYDLLSLEDKIAKLDLKFGKGVGAVIERAKLVSNNKTGTVAYKQPSTEIISVDAPKRTKAKDRRKQNKKEFGNEE